MMQRDTDILAARALSYWRGRYTPTYVGLRRLLEGRQTSHRHRSELLRNLAEKASRTAMFPLAHFQLYKETTETGGHKYRTCCACSPVSAVVETVVIHELSELRAFAQHPAVYSYRWPKERSGRTFAYFVDAYDERFQRLSRVLREAGGNAAVVVSDIRGFYPSIDTDRLLRELPSLPKGIRIAIEQLSSFDEGLPIGPALSHVLANHYLRELDSTLAASYPGRYFRYVDDIALVVPRRDAEETQEQIRRLLAGYNLEPQPDKSATISSDDWARVAPVLKSGPLDSSGTRMSLSDVFDYVRILLWRAPASFESALDSILVSEGLPFPVRLLKTHSHDTRWRKHISRALSLNPALRLRVLRDLVAIRLGRTRGVARQLRAWCKTLRGFYLERLSQHEPKEGDSKAAEGWLTARARRAATRLAFLLPREEYGILLKSIPESPPFAVVRATVRGIAEQRPSLLLPFCGGPVRQFGLLWEAHHMDRIRVQMSPRSPEFVEACLDLVFSGVVDADAIALEHCDETIRRRALALLRRSERRAEPDLGYDDELQTLLLGALPTDHSAMTREPGSVEEYADPLFVWGDS